MLGPAGTTQSGQGPSPLTCSFDIFKASDVIIVPKCRLQSSHGAPGRCGKFAQVMLYAVINQARSSISGIRLISLFPQK